MRNGKLYLITTPIGNLEDITQRAIKTLNKVNIVLAEDTRRTQNLLKHFKIEKKKLISYYEGNQWERIPQVIKRLEKGQNIGLVSNAGSPLIADPGYQLVCSVLEHGNTVVPIPGPSAVITALMGAGLPCDKFIFLGYLPKKSTKREKLFKSVLKKSFPVKTIVFYESPKRLFSTLKLIAANFGNVKISVAREMTKKHENFIRGKIKSVMKKIQEKDVRGEVTVVISLG